MTALPEKTEKKIAEMCKQYGKHKWEVLVLAVDREYEAMKYVKDVIAEGKKRAEADRARRTP